jgi:hypothetical protein
MTSHASAPVSKGTRSRSGAPAFSGLRRNGSVTVSHSELFQTFAGSDTGSFQILQASINPGLAYLFPWLHNVAINYEKYRFRKLKFRFVSAVPTSTLGFVALAVDPDANDTVPDSMPALMSFQGACSGNTWMSCDLQVPVAHLGELYLRSGTVPDTDVKTYDIGNFLYGTTTGIAEVDTLGYLYVDYEVDLINPAAHIVSGATSESFALTSTAHSLTVPFSGAQTYGTLPIQIGENAIGFDRVGVYQVMLQCGKSATGNADDYVDAEQTTVGWISPTENQGGTTFLNYGGSTAMSVVQFLVEVTESFQSLYFDLASAVVAAEPIVNSIISVLPNFVGLFASTGAVWHPPKRPSVHRVIGQSKPISESEARRRCSEYKRLNCVKSDSVSRRVSSTVSSSDNSSTAMCALRAENEELRKFIEQTGWEVVKKK